jgi:hypothetical protein
MSRYNDMTPEDLKDYQPIRERIVLFYQAYPDGRIISEIVKADRFEAIFKTTVYKDHRDLKENLPLANAFAQEFQDPDDFINDSCFLENCESSSIGRALRNAAIGDMGVSKEEMVKTQVHHPFKPAPTPKPAPKQEIDSYRPSQAFKKIYPKTAPKPEKPISVSGPKVAGSDSFEFKKIRPKLSEDQLRNYVIPQGIHKGLHLDQIDYAELIEYAEFLRGRPKQSLWMGELINHVDYFKTLNN